MCRSSFFDAVGAPPAKQAQLFALSPSEVLAAIESLYDDRLQPFGRILLKRLGERAVARSVGQDAAVSLARRGSLAVGGSVPHISRTRLRRVCERCRAIRVVATEGGEYVALLTSREPDFVDACSPSDPYPESLWQALASHFCGSSANEGWSLPGGRYACAQALVAWRLPCLAGRSLGEVCHIVQLAISQRQILGYCDGQVVPHSRSEVVVKRRFAALQRPVTTSSRSSPAGMCAAPSAQAGGQLPVASLDRARECLRQILQRAPNEPQEVPLPNIKRLFRSRFQVELSETMLGHPRLCDLLQDGRFSDICELRLQANGYVVLPRNIEGMSAEEEAAEEREGEQEEMSPAVGSSAAAPGGHSSSSSYSSSSSSSHVDPSGVAEQPALSSGGGDEEEDEEEEGDESAAHLPWEPVVARTFIHFPVSPSNGIGGAAASARPRSSSVPRDHGSSFRASAAPLEGLRLPLALGREEEDEEEAEFGEVDGGFCMPASTPSPRYCQPRDSPMTMAPQSPEASPFSSCSSSSWVSLFDALQNSPTCSSEHDRRDVIGFGFDVPVPAASPPPPPPQQRAWPEAPPALPPVPPLPRHAAWHPQPHQLPPQFCFQAPALVSYPQWRMRNVAAR